MNQQLLNIFSKFPCIRSKKSLKRMESITFIPLLNTTIPIEHDFQVFMQSMDQLTAPDTNPRVVNNEEEELADIPTQTMASRCSSKRALASEDASFDMDMMLLMFNIL